MLAARRRPAQGFCKVTRHLQRDCHYLAKPEPVADTAETIAQHSRVAAHRADTRAWRGPPVDRTSRVPMRTLRHPLPDHTPAT
jgi:hypothetical protein